MDRFRDYVSLILNGACIGKIRRKELEEEIRDHLEMLKKEYIKDGFSEEQAELKSIEEFGKIEDVNKEFRTVFTPFKRFNDAIENTRLLKECIQWTASILMAIVISLSIKSYAFAATEVKQCSMQSTLFDGQRLIESKMEYYFKEPQRGDIVIINEESQKGVLNSFMESTKDLVGIFRENKENEKKRLIKRIIGVPDDIIDIREGKVYINGRLLNEPYAKGATFPKNMKFPMRIPEKEYFVLGDNRENSMDSRDIGLISIHKVEGRAVFRLWPLDKFGGI
ncbi:MAG TPA: signal peptidase I [Clostridia bacterium]